MSSFITIEGSDGSGKSTLIGRMESHLRARGVPFKLTREPGGTPVAEEIRDIILKPNRKLSTLCELLLFEAARADHVETFIRPALASGQSVLCDRFTHSSLAYQGIARGLGEDVVKNLNRVATGGLEPDAVIWLKLDPKIAYDRIESRGGEKSRLDSEAMAFHLRVFDGFSQLAANDPERFIVLDASRSPEQVFQELLAHPNWVRHGDLR
ncbi:MAG: dTMP kinase [Deltaproteobacteria bacterium]|nr:dTMP kinase [Deltaproteobacteria bacterium]